MSNKHSQRNSLFTVIIDIFRTGCLNPYIILDNAYSIMTAYFEQKKELRIYYLIGEYAHMHS